MVSVEVPRSLRTPVGGTEGATEIVARQRWDLVGAYLARISCSCTLSSWELRVRLDQPSRSRPSPLNLPQARGRREARGRGRQVVGSKFSVSEGSTSLVDSAWRLVSTPGHWLGGLSSASHRGSSGKLPAPWRNPLTPASLSPASSACEEGH